MTIFDFDKTLTNKDTLYGFYYIIDNKHPLFQIKRLLQIFSAVLYKMKIISNTQLKIIGVKLFLKGKSKQYIHSAAKEYAKKIVLNEIYSNFYLTTNPESRLIISASLEEYLNEIFQCEKVIGSSLLYENGRVKSLEKNMYGKEKLITFQKMFHNSKIDKIYTDSYSDLPLIEKAEEVCIIKNGKIVGLT